MTEEKKIEGAQEEKKIEKAEEIKKSEEKLEPTITEDELVKSIKYLEDIIKARKAPPVEEEEEEEEEDEEEEKSVTGNFEEDETIAKAIEVSEFLAALVDQTETSLDTMNDKVSSMEKSMSKFDQKYVEALAEVGKLVKSEFAKIDARLQKIEVTPVQPKSIVKGGTVLEKSFDGSAGAGSADSIDQMPKRRVMELLEKAVVDGKIKDSIMFAYEGSPSYRFLDAEKDILKSYIK